MPPLFSKLASLSNDDNNNYERPLDLVYHLIVATGSFFLIKNIPKTITTVFGVLFSRGRAPQSLSAAAPTKIYDVVVVGGGSAGLTAAKFAGGTMGNSVVIIEENKLGGDCTWTGCVPSKSLIASAKAAHTATKQALMNRGGAPPGSDGVGGGIHFEQVRQNYEKNRQLIYDADDSEEALAKVNVQTIAGRALLTSPTTLQVTTDTTRNSTGSNGEETESFTVEAREGIILCTGAAPRTPNIAGIQDVEYITYETVWDLQELPERLTIVGGGPIGCELAQAFARLGSKVTIVAPTLLPTGEPEVSEILKDIFEEEGIVVVEGKVQKVEKSKTDSHTVTSSNGSIISGDVLLLSIGRIPNVRKLGLDTVGITTSSETGGIVVDAKLQTGCPGIYAAGDCTGDKQFTHYAGFQGAIAARNILLPLSDRGVLNVQQGGDVPACTFTSPEVASLGYTEATAVQEFGPDAVGVSTMKLSHVDRAICEGNTKGIFKVIYRKKNGYILGATIMAPGADALISEIAVAKAAKLPFDQLAKVIHPYPSYAIALQIMASEVYYENTMKLKPLYAILKRIGL